MASKKKGAKKKVIKNKSESIRKVKSVKAINNSVSPKKIHRVSGALTMFAILTIVSLWLFNVVEDIFFRNIFLVTIILFGVITLALLISLLVLIFARKEQ